MSNVVTVRVHPNERIVQHAVKTILDKNHEKRFKQQVLDFYRQDYTSVVNNHQTLDDVLMVLAIQDDIPVGLSACLILNKDKKIKDSITVVGAQYRKQGVGTKLLQSKVLLLRKFYPHLTIKSFVNKSNEAGLKLCQKAGMSVRKNGKKVINAGSLSEKVIDYCIFGVQSDYR